jgi:hypothetical protein
MNNVMLDIETLGTNVDSIVLQVSLVRFDRQGNIGESLSLCLNVGEQESLGLKKDDSTIEWWNNTNPELFKRLLFEGVASLSDSLNQISSFFQYGDVLWCHATFDAPILSNLFKITQKRIPWKYTNVRDIRTLVDLSHLNLSDYNWVKEKTHDALDDCKFQIKYCCDAFKRLRVAE